MSPPSRNKPIRFLFENSLFLIGGAVVALVWANSDHHGYHDFVHHVLAGDPESGHPFTIHFLVNDVLMALFFAIAAKEVWEALLPGGSLSNPRKAATPLLATFGGMAVPACFYAAGVAIWGPAEIARGWAIPMATDIAFSYLAARLIFGGRHVAIPFLLLLAIADDAGGLMILAVFFPQDTPEPVWLLLTAGAIAIALTMRRMRLQSFWWYLLGPGVLSWFSFYHAHLHPALGLVPIIPAMPHAHSDLGLFIRRELGRTDTLNAFEHWWKNPVELILGLFGLVNAGVVVSSVGPGTWYVMAGLMLGKPIGVTLFVLIGRRFGLQTPAGMGIRHVFIVGLLAGLGFTVSLFMAAAAFPAGRISADIVDSVKLGALASFIVFPLSIVAARWLGIRPETDETPATTVKQEVRAV